MNIGGFFFETYMVTYDPTIRKYAVSMKKKGLDIFITVEKKFFFSPKQS